MNKLGWLLAASALLVSPSAQAQQIDSRPFRIGISADMTGFLSDIGGSGSVTAAQMAVEDFGGKVLGRPIEVLVGDNQNKTDIAVTQVRSWFDTQGVSMVNDLGNSAVALAVSGVAREKNRIAIANSPGTTRLTNEECSPNTIHYAYDTYALAHGTAGAVVADKGDSWFFITVDFAGGHSLEKDATEVIKVGGGQVLGAARHPLGTTDFASYLLQAQASGAKVIGIANAGMDAVNTIKSAYEFGLPKSQTIAGLYVFSSDVEAMGAEVAQGMWLSTGFYWDMNDDTRAWGRRFTARHKKTATMVHAGVYSSTMHYLKAVQAVGSDDAAAVMAWMRANPVRDFFTANGVIRADGRMVHDMYLAQVKKPSEQRYPGDLYHIRGTIPGGKAFRPLAESLCPLVKSN